MMTVLQTKTRKGLDWGASNFERMSLGIEDELVDSTAVDLEGCVLLKFISCAPCPGIRLVLLRS